MSGLRRLVTGLRRARPEPEPAAAPVLSVVVPVYQADRYLGECLDSLRSQTYRQLQIVVIDDGSTDGSAEVIAEHAAVDERIVVHRQANAGLGAARQAGIARATGTYLTFLDADDTLPPDAYALLVDDLERSGSDFAIGAVQRVWHGVRRTPAWIAEVHERDRIGIHIDEFPRAVRDVIACNRVFRRSFWDRAGLAFPVGVAYEDHVPMMAAYLRADRFDVLAAATYYWRIREDETSIGQQKHELANLRDRLRAKRDAWELVSREATAPVQAAWRARVLDMDLPLFVEQVPGADDEYVATLREGVREHLAAADDEVLGQVRAERRVKARLVAAGRRAELEALLAREEQEGPVGATEVVGTDIVAAYPDLAGVAEVTVADRTLTAHQTRLRCTLWRCRWSAPGVLDLDLAAYVPYLDLRDRQPRVEVVWVGSDGERTPVPAQQYADPEITRAAQPTVQCYDPAGVRVHVDVRPLLAAAGTADGGERGDRIGSWHLEVTVGVAGLTRTDVVRSRRPDGSAGTLRPCSLPGGLRLELDHDRAHGLVLRAHRSPATLVAAQADGTDLLLTVASEGTALARLVALGSAGRVGAPARPAATDQQARLALGRLHAAAPAGRWVLRAVTTRSAWGAIAWPPEVAEEFLPVAGAAELALCRSDAAAVALAARPLGIELRAVEVAADRLAFVVRTLPGQEPPAALTLAPVSAPGSGDPSSPLQRTSDDTWVLPDGPGALAAEGEWQLLAHTAAGESVRVRLGPDVLAGMPMPPTVEPPVRTRVLRARGGGLGVVREPAVWCPAPLGERGRGGAAR